MTLVSVTFNLLGLNKNVIFSTIASLRNPDTLIEKELGKFVTFQIIVAWLRTALDMNDEENPLIMIISNWNSPKKINLQI